MLISLWFMFQFVFGNGGISGHQHVKPPSITSLLPVGKLLAFEARQTTAGAISSGSPIRSMAENVIHSSYQSAPYPALWHHRRSSMTLSALGCPNNPRVALFSEPRESVDWFCPVSLGGLRGVLLTAQK
jgi:hypothetical protein